MHGQTTRQCRFESKLMQVDESKQYPIVNLLGIGIHSLGMEDVINICKEHIYRRRPLLLGVVNVAKIVNIQKNPELRAGLEQADLVLADGVPIVWLSRILGNPLPQRVAGIDIMLELLKQADQKYYRIYFLGAEKEVLYKVIEAVQKNYPGICIAGYKDGYFTEDQEQSVAEDIKSSRADILFVAISSPKKEIFLGKWLNFINVPVCHGVGGSFDVLAGVTKRSPLWMQKSGLEWFYRLVQEPRRMWKRYLVTNSIFVKLSFEAILQTWFGKLFSKFRAARDSCPRKEDE
jgi:N-acetylglucosaminyldiphosphoundecaprenol N-acetyl-beta-D-mannosaminyltransferase